MGRRAFLTGATGFVGRHLVERLAANDWSIRALVRKSSRTDQLVEAGAELVTGDLRDADAIAEGANGCDVVFHLAAVTAAQTESEYRRANEDGTRAVLEGIARTRSAPGALVYLSSYAAAGPAAPGSSRSREDAPAPLTAYGRTKLAGEAVARDAGVDGTRIVIIRSPAVYGPGDRALLPYFQLIRAGFAPLPGGEDRSLHLIFAPDLAVALENGADADSGVYAVADPQVHRWSEVVKAIATAVGRNPIRIPLPPRLVRWAAATTEGIGRLAGRAVPFNREKAEEMLASAWVCDLTGSERLLPSQAVTSLPAGLERTVRWYIRQGWL